MTEPEKTPLQLAIERAKANAPETGIDVTAVVEIPAKPKPAPAVPPPHTELPKEREL